MTVRAWVGGRSTVLAWVEGGMSSVGDWVVIGMSIFEVYSFSISKSFSNYYLSLFCSYLIPSTSPLRSLR